jgi:hypothetical protein
MDEYVKRPALLLISFFILVNTSAFAQSKHDSVKQVRFERGASGTTITGTLIYGAKHFYRLNTRKGQTQSDSALAAALREEYPDGDYGDFRYFLKWFDLNGDGEPEAIVYVAGPRVCGTGGCNAHIFARREGGYKLISTIGISRPPIIASHRRTHGWKNLIVFVAGGGVLPGYYAELPFDGSTYPESSSDERAKEVKGQPRGVTLIKRFRSYLEGKSLNPQGRSDKR